MPAKTAITPEPMAEGQRLYEQTLTSLADIATLLEISARALASLARTLRETAALNAAGTQAPDESVDDPVPRNIDELREALARRIEAIAATGHAADSG